VCPPIVTSENLVNLHDIWKGGDSIQGGVNVIIFNPITSNVLKWLRFKFQIFSVVQKWFGTGYLGMYFTKGNDIILK
jgi:prolipoprotein diacylglyceryltransferase